ncbi:DNA-3-methyladenine glycosylase I [Herbiconiux liukaitaii]|uniref:DNA-3-methyladenine glycosylase I n=1 Tax=Herbiconiux liukaitaii TaxID=3342799 RepID=UPI0035B9F236
MTATAPAPTAAAPPTGATPALAAAPAAARTATSDAASAAGASIAAAPLAAATPALAAPPATPVAPHAIVANTPDGTCPWATSSAAMRAYHDEEWGIPRRDDPYLFEMLILEGAQAGLSWSTILSRREGYRRAFKGFDVAAVATMTDDELTALMADPGIIRNRLKIFGARRNALAFQQVQATHGSFAAYLWGWVGDEPIVNGPRTFGELAPTTPLSDEMSRDLKKRGFTFMGSTITYAYLEAVGVVNDHIQTCPAPSTRPTPPRA